MPGFNPERLKEIRIVRKMTQNQLAETIGVTKQAVSKYELGKSIPSSEVISRILEVLNIPGHFLNKESLELTGKNSVLFFRTASTTTMSEIEFANIKSKWGYEVLAGMSQFSDIPRMNLPIIEKDLSIPEKALYLRRFWNLGTAPITNMTAVLESNGIFVFVINSSELNTEAYSRIINGVPIVVLNEHKGTAVRWRFSLAHELGHLVLHRNISGTEFKHSAKEIEEEASLFASSFLMPIDSFGNSVVSSKLEYLLALKNEWKVSIAAMIYHCKKLGIVDNRQAEALQMRLSKKGWRKKEPLDDMITFERPLFLHNQVKKCITDKNSFEQFINTTRLPIRDLEQLCSLPVGYFSDYETNVPSDEGIPVEYEQLSFLN